MSARQVVLGVVLGAVALAALAAGLVLFLFRLLWPRVFPISHTLPPHLALSTHSRLIRFLCFVLDISPHAALADTT